MLSRRDLAGTPAAGVAGGVILAASGKRASAAVAPTGADGPSGREDDTMEDVRAATPGSASEAPSASVAPPPWGLFRPLAVGTLLAHGWRLSDVSAPIDGACVVTLQNERGRVQRVHVCRNDGRPRGLVYTSRLDLVVMNGGEGDLETEENMAQAVAEISRVLAANEGDAANRTVIDALLPHAERLQQFSDANEWTLR